MTVRANADLKFLRKYFFIAIACILFALYCLLDGIVLAPKKMPKSEAYAKLVAEVEDSTEQVKRWQQIVKENKWEHAIPEKTPEKLRSYIFAQYVMAAICFAVAIPMLLWYFKNKTSWVEGNERSLTDSFGRGFDFSNIEKVDKKKWETKGIAKVYLNEDGSERKYVLDDFKYERAPMGEIMEMLEKTLKPEQIIDGS